jgi:hypothetical protein
MQRYAGSSPTSLSNPLGSDRCEVEALLRKHNVTEDLGAIEDYLSDTATLATLRTNAPCDAHLRRRIPHQVTAAAALKGHLSAPPSPRRV